MDGLEELGILLGTNLKPCEIESATSATSQECRNEAGVMFACYLFSSLPRKPVVSPNFTVLPYGVMKPCISFRLQSPLHRNFAMSQRFALLTICAEGPRRDYKAA